MSKSRRVGTAWESAVVTYLRERGWPYAERRALAGSNDRGDIAGVVGVVIEAKSVARVELAAFLDEAHVEAANDRADMGVVWLKRRGRTSAREGYVVMDGETFTRLLSDAGYGGGALSEGAS
jgi:predicted lipoprotein